MLNLTVLLLAGLARGGEIKEACLPVGKDPDAVVLKINYFSWRTETDTSLTPDQLSRLHTFQFESREDAPNPANANSLALTIDGTFIKRCRPEEIDCRWSFTISDNSGHEKLCIYADTFLSRAVVKGMMFTPDKPFKDWVNGLLRSAFQLEDTIK